MDGSGVTPEVTAARGLPDAQPGPSAVWVNPPDPGVLPRGVSHRTFHSPAHGTDVGYCIYLTPGSACATP